MAKSMDKPKIPVILRPIHAALLAFSSFVSWIVTRIVLITIFFFVVTPIAIILRLLRKDLLNLKFQRSGDTYWIDKKVDGRGRERYESQF